MKWWCCPPKRTTILIAILLSTAPLSPLVTRVHAQAAPADTSAVPPAPGDPGQAPAPAATTPVPPPAAAAPAVDPKAEKARIEAERKAVADKEKADRKAKELAAIEDARKAGIPWYKGANWMTFKLGFAGSKVENSPDASIGVGIAAHHFMGASWAVGLNADFDVLGRFGSATEMELPLTLEAQRHFRWGSDSFRPFAGVGFGVAYYRTYRTGEDGTELRPMYFLSGGFNSPVASNALLGITGRMELENEAESDNPYFPNDSNSAVHWTIKLTYSHVR